MNKLSLAHVLGTLVVSTVLGALPACYGDLQSAQGGDLAEASSAETASPIVGRWQFVYDAAARSRVEGQIAASTEDAGEQAKAKVAAEKEAAASRIELTEDGELFSWVEGELVLQARYASEPVSKGQVRVSMTVDGVEKSTTITLHGDDEIVIDDPKKGPLTFRRVK